jgi:uncharacterized RDD family membrane protein YckC
MVETGISKHHFVARESARLDELDGAPLARFWQRALGFLIDFAIVVTLWAPAELAWSRFVSHEWDGESKFHVEFSFHEWRSLAIALLYWVFITYFSNGKSIGKWIARTRVVSLTHAKVGLWQSVERVLGYAASAAELIGFLQYFFSPNRMCAHDRMAETIVIDTRRKPPSAAGQ